MNKFKKFTLLLLIFLLLNSPIQVFADDNATSGDGDTQNALKDKGFYRGSEYMYKVSVYVGLSGEVGKDGSLSSDFKMIGNQPVYIKPSHFGMTNNVSFASNNKTSYYSGGSLRPNTSPQILVDDPPPIPITNGGNIGSVKSYFGDTETLNAFIDAFALQKGTTREGLVSNMTFTIEGESKRLPPEEVLPIKKDGIYKNKVPWVIIYEPVIISYLKDRTTILAFTATEYALAQKLGYFNFKSGPDGQYISAMTHSDLPNSIVLEESWFGYPVISPLPDGVKWDEDRIIQGGGWGMRMFRANGKNVIENDTTYDYNYRVDTDVITSVRVYADGDRITPDEKAYITFNANGATSTTEVTIPEDGSQLVFIKWHTPSTPGEVNIDVSVTGNPAARLGDDARSATLTANIVDLNENVPPNPTANDRKPYGYRIPSVPIKAQKTSATWGEWECEWVPDWQWVPNWIWESKWEKDYYTYHHRGGCKDTDGDGDDDYCPGHRRYRWVDRGKWVDHGEWVDFGDWEYTWISYTASLSAELEIKPDDKVPTANSNRMKSGYGINQKVMTSFYSNAPNSHFTPAQNAIAYYPEFNYEGYLRLMERINSGYSASFELKENKYSTYNNRVHFTPIWFPNGTYQVYTEVIDVWTPAGMLSCNLTDSIIIQGSLYDDWHIGPTKQKIERKN